MKQQHIHFIGICGVAMSALAIAFHKQGWYVTGSDVGFYPPISTHLTQAGIAYYPGWHVHNMIRHSVPDIVVVGNVASSTNPEWIYVQEHHIPYKSYPEIVQEHLIKKNSIVCAGTYGKSTTSALLSWILTQEQYNPSYLIGGLTQQPMDAATITMSEYSIVEGDEYKTARWDNRPKFKLYTPTHLLLTAVSWDHADLYKTEASYMNEFHDLVHMIPSSGCIVAHTDHPGVQHILSTSPHASVITYGRHNQDYVYRQLSQTQDGISFDIIHHNTSYHITSPMLGTYMAENITGVFAMAHTLGISPHMITKHIASFHGMKRRLEKRYGGDITIFDDIAHSPEKAASVLATIRSLYTGNIIAIYEPNGGNRQRASIPQYTNAFRDADIVIIPKLTTIKTDKTVTELPIDGQELHQVIQSSHPNVHYMDQDEALISYIHTHTKPHDVVVFLGSHGFRGMIETLINHYS